MSTGATHYRLLAGGWVFLGALLLFCLEPQVGRLVTTQWGSGAYAWSTCLMFFQGTLFVGYLYCHLVLPRVGGWHLAVVAMSLLALPVTLTAQGMDAGPWGLLGALVVGVALPFAVLSATAVAAQRWLASSDERGGRDPYALYAISNAGSMVGLLIYPVAIEPLLGLRAQSWVWAALYVVHALWGVVLMRRLGVLHAGRGPEPVGSRDRAHVEPSQAMSMPTGAAMLVLAAAPAALLVAVTALASRHLGAVPYVWVAPLALYLLSFVLSFAETSRVPWLFRRFWLELVGLGLFFYLKGDSSVTATAVQLVVLFVVSSVAHRQLYAMRPPSERLTGFYLLVALGGWGGSAFATLGAPRIFASLTEYPLAIVAVIMVIAALRRRELPALLRAESRLLLGLSVAVLVLVAYRANEASTKERDGVILEVRNALGVYAIRDKGGVRALAHEGVVHGLQFRAPEKRRIPLSYYSAAGPLGEVVRSLRRPCRMGAVGMGAGTLATYLEPGEVVRFYELDRQVVELAQRFFTYLADSPGGWDAILGDARVQMSRRADDDHAYALVLVDAFSGGAIPTHLLTVEALRVYEGKLAPGGVLLFHISSQAYDLRPVLAANARALGWYGTYRDHTPDVEGVVDASSYVALSVGPEALAPLVMLGWEPVMGPDTATVDPWTDDFASVMPVMRWSVFAGALGVGER